ncbi:MAG: 50S ribosomal protein L29 [Gammaproteobacteria bacterium]|nr:MAG: 50S ribosomal protein L29 [Gammaproteobacteria bacterium]
MKIADIREKNDQELQGELKSLYKEQFNLRMQRGVQQSPKPSEFKKVRKTIARIKTVLNQNSKKV